MINDSASPPSRPKHGSSAHSRSHCTYYIRCGAAPACIVVSRDGSGCTRLLSSESWVDQDGDSDGSGGVTVTVTVTGARAPAT